MERQLLSLGVLLFCIAASEAFFGVRTQDGVDYAVVFPRKIRFSTPTDVVVTATGMGGRAAFLDLRLSNDITVLLQTQLHFTEESMRTWRIVVTPDMVPPGTRSLTLEAGSESDRVELDPGTGHVFIQLDKSLYQPKQHVKYRILALDEDMRWAGWPVKVEIKTPDDVLLDSATFGSEEAFTGKQFYLPKHAVLGRWQISATFTNTGQITTSATAYFEVSEYVLPGFSVSLTSSYSLVLPLNEFFTATVSARYTYDKPVEGTAYVRIGVVRERDIALFDKKYEVPLDEAGKAKLIFRTEELKSSSLWFPEGRRLYIKATVVDNSTGEVREATNQSILFSSKVYRVNVDRTRKLYKPGLPHRVEVYITRLNGERAGGINVLFLITRDGSTEYKFLTTDMNGSVTYVMETSPQPGKISISVRTLDPYVWVQTTEDFELTPYEGLGEQSLTVEADQVYEGSGLDLTLVYKPHLNFIRPRALIHVLVVSGGRIVHHDSVRMSIAGRHQLSLPAHLVSEWSPQIRVVALHVDDADSKRPQAVVVADSTLVDLPRTCRHELTLSYPEGETTYVREPKQEAEMEINGAPGMRVGLVAVDKALYALNNERSLTRETIFKSLEQHDLGSGIGEGMDAKKVLQNAGLRLLAFRASPRTDLILNGPVRQLSSNLYPDRFFSHVPEHSDPEPDAMETIPLEEIRKDFPEAWLFQEEVLNGSGQGHVDFRLPDVITTWVMHAVGVAPTGGACVSNSLDYVTFKPFFVKVTLPFKAVRLEEITVEVTIRSYQPHNMRVRLHVSGDDGLCFTGSRRRNSNLFTRRLQIPAGGAKHYKFTVIPLRVGSLNLTVSALALEIRTRDTVMKPLYVVAEGRRINKAWTFALDPEGKQLPSVEDHEVSRGVSPSIKRQMDSGAKRQLTQIDLALPSEVIPDSGHCKIAAFGDLMGDVIYHAILQSEPEAGGELLGAEDVLGTLAPVVYALHYLNQSGLLNDDIAFDAKEQIRTGITNLMKYRTIDFAYTETPASLLSQGSVWLTAEVVKTLCHARELTYVNSLMIDLGISWLLGKVKDGRVVETETNAYTNTRDRAAILNAEVLITLYECKYTQNQAAETVFALLNALLEDFLVKSIDTPSLLVLAKTAYAFQLSQNSWAPSILDRLDDWATRTNDNLVYWSDFILDTQRQETLPYWYRSGPDATSIEATAYALLAYLQSPSAPTAPVAEWLIRQRGDVGIFIGALDTAAATRALAAYSLSKETAETHLHCNISTEPMANYSHTLEFTAEDAMVQKALLDVPIGRKLNVTASGKGLGQMQVSVGYHVPVRPNENCRFNLTVERQPAYPRYMSVDPQEHPLCMFCGYDCPDGVTSDFPHRKRRSIGYSKTALCVRVCLGHLGEENAGKTMLDIGVLNGYEPIIEDIKSFTNQLPNVIAAEHDVNKGTIRVALREVPNNETLCLAFRSKDMEEVAFQKPALVTVREARWRDDSCVTSYEPAENSVTVQTLCANTNEGYKALCKCVSGRCPTCGPTFGEHYGIAKLQREICAAAYAYEVQVEEEYEEGGWKETVHRIVQVGRMTDLHKVEVGERVVVVSQESCPCPRYRPGEAHWILGKEVIRFRNRDGEDIYKYPVDETSLFLSVSEREQRGRTISRLHLEAALRNARERC